MKNACNSRGTNHHRAGLEQSSSNLPIANSRNQGRVFAALIAIVVCLAAPPGHALSETEVAAISKIISNSPPAELPPKSAEIVANARQSEKEATAVAVVRAAIARKPASAVSVVSSTVKAAPFTAPAVAAAAAKLAPDQAVDIGIAAALQAPELAEEESAAIAKVNPESAERVAQAIHSAVHNTSRAGVKSGEAEEDRPSAENPSSDKRHEPNKPVDDDDSLFSARPRDYGSPGHPPHPVHPVHPVHPPHPRHPVKPPHPSGSE